jgi:hypothetical protein
MLSLLLNATLQLVGSLQECTPQRKLRHSTYVTPTRRGTHQAIEHLATCCTATVISYSRLLDVGSLDVRPKYPCMCVSNMQEISVLSANDDTCVLVYIERTQTTQL